MALEFLAFFCPEASFGENLVGAREFVSGAEQPTMLSVERGVPVSREYSPMHVLGARATPASIQIRVSLFRYIVFTVTFEGLTLAGPIPAYADQLATGKSLLSDDGGDFFRVLNP